MTNIDLALRFVLAVAGVWFVYTGLRHGGAITAVLWREWKTRNDRAVCVFAWFFVMALYGGVTLLGLTCLFVAVNMP